MLRPSMSQILKPGESYYEFVIAVARKAREIASEAEENHEMLPEKPVSMAVALFASGEEKLSELDVSMERQTS
ncbi:MAG: DNA-directed RNA polymerase subunit omega [Angelakisella sp.]